MTLWLVVLVPIVGAVVATRARRVAHVIALAALAATAVAGASAAATGSTSIVSWGPRLALTVAATDFARVMIVVVPLIALPIVLYSAATEPRGRVRLVALLTAFVGAMELLVVADDLLTLLVGWELVGAFSWILIAHDWRSTANVQQASHAFITTRFGDLGLYIAAGIVFASTGTFAFSEIARSGSTEIQIVAGGILLAAAAKSAQVPFSPWLFSAMAGPTPVSALLHSSTMVAAGAYLLVRLAPHVESVTWFAPAVIAIGLTSTLAGGLVAAVHRHPKRLLAASTTAQYGLMFVAVGAGSVVGAAAQLVTHATFKSLLFLTAGAAMHAADSDDLAGMRLGRRLPLIAAFAAIGVLALAGLPPLGGAWSKDQIAGAAFEFSPLVGAAVFGAAVLGAFYGVRYWLLAFGPGPVARREPTGTEATSSIGWLAFLSLGLAVLWLPSVNQAAAHIAGGDVAPPNAVETALGLAAVVIAAGLVVALGTRQRLADVPLAVVAHSATAWFGIAAVARRVVVDPVLATARVLGVFDDHVIDAGIRASARIAAGFSRLLQRRSELSIDGIVDGVGRGTLLIAGASRVTDDYGVDRTAEGLARGLGRAGQLLRRLQTGLSHHYYVIVAVGLIALAAVLLGGTS